MAKIPEKKRDRQELQEMRNRNAFAVRPPVELLQSQALPKPILILFYFLAATAAGLVTYAFSPHGLVLAGYFMVGITCAVIVMLMAVFIFLKKPRSRHHAAFLAIISLLVLVFGSVYYFEQFEQQTHDDTQGSTRY